MNTTLWLPYEHRQRSMRQLFLDRLYQAEVDPKSRTVQLENGRNLNFIAIWQPSQWAYGGVWDEQKPPLHDGPNRPPNKLRVICSLDNIGNHDVKQFTLLLHVSLSYSNKLPSWKDVKLVRDAFYPPDVDVMMILPKEGDYITDHEYTFHLQETPSEWGIL